MSNLSRRKVLAAAAQPQPSEPIEGNRGASILGPRNAAREAQNPDLLRPPVTDNGQVPNLRFSFADAHVKMREGGWSRQVTQTEHLNVDRAFVDRLPKDKRPGRLAARFAARRN